MPKKNGDRVLMGVVKNHIILAVYGLGCFFVVQKSRRLAMRKGAMVSHLLPDMENISPVAVPQSPKKISFG